jgi:predicted nucleic acid-binding protein
VILDTDTVYAYLKAENRLKDTADKLLKRIHEGAMGKIGLSVEAFHELYYISKEEGLSFQEISLRFSALLGINNLSVLSNTAEINLLAISLTRLHGLTSIFDAYYAATALNMDPDRTIISTDETFDKIPGIKRVNPKSLV